MPLTIVSSSRVICIPYSRGTALFNIRVLVFEIGMDINVKVPLQINICVLHLIVISHCLGPGHETILWAICIVMPVQNERNDTI